MAMDADERTEGKKRAIMKAALEILTEKGYHPTTIEEIAERAGVGKGTVYLACESKEDLFYQALHRQARCWNAENASVIDPRSPADELLGRLMLMSVTKLDRWPLVRELVLGEARRELPEWTERFAELRKLCAAPVAEVLGLGVRQGLFRPDLDVDLGLKIIRNPAEYPLTAKAK